ncbi:hypothetical protein RHGRI_026825 [Rhododendron griersonianum]|uniref:URB1 C-terminal domain-containing protein n=1 Tax=Rhododendron griersonianum TaxID=479676 RepID=A0AAV6IU21_9ERIC|nr:hypothetical protein RHGRI_026825 [Rhododendron griersonianum]
MRLRFSLTYLQNGIEDAWQRIPSITAKFVAEASVILDRLWILRLLYAGLDSDDDAQIYIRNNILEILLGFYASPLSDIESKELNLQVWFTEEEEGGEKEEEENKREKKKKGRGKTSGTWVG